MWDYNVCNNPQTNAYAAILKHDVVTQQRKQTNESGEEAEAEEAEAEEEVGLVVDRGYVEGEEVWSNYGRLGTPLEIVQLVVKLVVKLVVRL